MMAIGRSGEPWTPVEEAHLVRLFRAGLPLAAIATHIERSPAAVTTRLVRLGLLIYVSTRGAWFDVSVPWAVRPDHPRYPHTSDSTPAPLVL